MYMRSKFGRCVLFHANSQFNWVSKFEISEKKYQFQQVGGTIEKDPFSLHYLLDRMCCQWTDSRATKMQISVFFIA